MYLGIDAAMKSAVSSYDRSAANINRNIIIVHMIDVLVDILEELRLLRTGKQKDRLSSASKKLVYAEWRDIALVIDRACLMMYIAANVIFISYILDLRPGDVLLGEVELPTSI